MGNKGYQPIDVVHCSQGHCHTSVLEFVGNVWFGWLLKKRIPFCIRVKSNTIITNALGLDVNVDFLFYALKAGEYPVLQNKWKFRQQHVYLSALRLADGELLNVATDQLMQDPIQHYAKRWEIETLFAYLKSKGFNFEDTHVTHPERIEKLLALLTIAFCLVYKTGEWRHEKKPITIKKHGRKAVSLFRYGLDFLRDIVLNGVQQANELLTDIVGFLSMGAVTGNKTCFCPVQSSDL